MSNKHASRPFILLAVLSAVVVAAIVVGVTQPLSAAQFANTGHWVYNSLKGIVFHVDGATANIDAQLPLDADQGSQVLQSDTSGFVVGQNRITEFDKASLEEEQSIAPPAKETPLGIEVVGGPYAVYRESGHIVRLGDPAASIPTDGPIGDPVVTEDGTLWFHRVGRNQICTVELDGVTLAGCPVSAQPDHPGAMTIVGERPAFLDLFTRTLHTIDGDTLDQGVELGVPLSPNARPAARDTDGRLAILDQGPAQSSLVLVDLRTSPATSKTVTLRSGDFDGPVSTGEVIALVDRQQGTVLTFDTDGEKKDEKPLKDKDGEPRLSQGEDERIYVEDADGSQVLVVDEDGDVTDVDVVGKPATPKPDAKPEGTPERGPGVPDETDAPDEDARGPAGPPPVNPRPPDEETVTPPPLPPSRPGAPPGVTARPGQGSATVTWGAAADNRAPITGYVVSWRGSNGQTGSVTVGGGVRSAPVPGLTDGVRYVISVAATNRMGAGPAAAAAPVTPTTPVSPAAPPVNLVATFDVDDRPTRTVTLTWDQPALGGGTLVHYQVSATGGRPMETVTATTHEYPNVEATEVITFTVRAVTKSPSGQTLVGAPATATHEDEVPTPVVQIAQGGESSTGNCGPPNCFWVNATMSGFEANTSHRIRLSSQDNENVVTENFTTDASGAGTYNQLNYDVPGNQVWVSVETSSGWIESDPITWEGGTRMAPAINLSKGPLTEDHCGEYDGCAWMYLVLSGFAPGTEYLFIPHSDREGGYFNEGHTKTTDADGGGDLEAFAYAGPGETVWVTVDVPGYGPVESNPLVW
ncbi:fibronectin type III domain-containing protein [Actinophytocola sediminis]